MQKGWRVDKAKSQIGKNSHSCKFQNSSSPTVRRLLLFTVLRAGIGRVDGGGVHYINNRNYPPRRTNEHSAHDEDSRHGTFFLRPVGGGWTKYRNYIEGRMSRCLAWS